MSVNFMDALPFPFQDKNWIAKLAITFVMLIIPVFGWLVIAGYSVRVVRSVLTDEDIPEYDDFGGDFVRGLAVFIGALVFSIPSMILSGIQARMGFCGFGCLLGMAQFLYNLFMTPLMMSAVARYSLREDLNAFLDFQGRIQDVTENLGEVVALWINLFIMGIVFVVVLPIGLAMCILPGFMVMAAMVFVSAHMTAQWGMVIGVGGYDGYGGPKKKKNLFPDDEPGDLF